MATLTGTTIAGSYKDLLKIAEASKQAGLDTTLRAVEDGDATASALNLSTTSASIGHTVTTSDAGSKALFIDANTSGVAAQDSTGLHIDFDRTVAGSGTAAHNDIGIDLDVNSASLGTSSLVGMDIDVVGAASGTSTATGLAVTVGSADTNYAAVFSGGNVGIGTASPSSLLEIENSSGVATLTIDAGGTTDALIRLDDAGSPRWYIYNDASDSDDLDIESAVGLCMTIAQAGNVGIGTATPTSKLTIAPNEVLLLRDGAAGNYSGLRYDAAGNETLIMSVKNVASKIMFDVGHDIVANQGSGGYAPSDPELTIADGSVGIGDSSPDAHLDVEDLTVDTTTSYTGIMSNHTKTLGVTDSADSFTGIASYVTWDDAVDVNSCFGTASAFYGQVVIDDSVGQSTSMQGIGAKAKMVIGDVTTVHGAHVTTDIDGGTVDATAYGILIDLDVEPAVQHSVGLHINQDNNAECLGGEPHGRGIDIRSNTNIDMHLVAYDGIGDTWAIQMTRAGQIDAEGTINQSQSLDYAEYFESKDGKVIAIGKTVKLDGEKIVVCEEGDTPIGVIRPAGSSSVVGGGQMFHWQGRFMKDDYSATVWEDYTLKQWDVEITFDEYIARGKDESGGSIGGMVKDEKVEGSKAIPAKEAVTQQKTVDEEVEEEVTTTEVVLEDGKYVQKTTTETVTKTVKVPQYDEEDLYDEDGEVIGKHQVPIMETVKEAVSGVDAVPDTYFREHKYHSDRIPDGLTVPDDAKTVTPGNQRQKLNPDFDPSKSEAYKSREERDEWHIVGLLGQIPITKGQPTGNWIKMKDVSDTVEMYFVK